MKTYSKIRELVKLERALETEARRMPRGSQGRADRMREAQQYRVKCLWLAGRISNEAYGDYLKG